MSGDDYTDERGRWTLEGMGATNKSSPANPNKDAKWIVHPGHQFYVHRRATGGHRCRYQLRHRLLVRPRDWTSPETTMRSIRNSSIAPMHKYIYIYLYIYFCNFIDSFFVEHRSKRNQPQGNFYHRLHGSGW